jgi:hypothetical protein
VVETEMHIFLGKQIITLSHAAHIKLNATVHIRSHHFSLLPSTFYFLIHYSVHHTHFPYDMVREADKTLLAAGDAVASESKVTSSAESDAASTSSSSNAATQTLIKKDVLKLYEYWKKSMVTKADCAAAS